MNPLDSQIDRLCEFARNNSSDFFDFCLMRSWMMDAPNGYPEIRHQLLASAGMNTKEFCEFIGITSLD